MQMGVDEARHYGPAWNLDYLGVPRIIDLPRPADRFNQIALDDHGRVLDRIAAGAVDQYGAS